MDQKKKVMVLETAEILAERAAHLFSKTVLASVAARGRCMVALSGGSTPRRAHVLLGRDPYRSSIPWNRVHLYWSDERCVPWRSQWSNYGRAEEDFMRCVDIPIKNIHPMPSLLPPEEGAVLYEKEVPEVFDLVFLGLGVDGHTASLFPDHDALGERKRLVLAVKGRGPDIPRLTMTFPLINKARHIIFLVSGEEKAEIVKAALEDRDAGLPAVHVLPITGALTWVLDRAAAFLLSKETLRG